MTGHVLDTLDLGELGKALRAARAENGLTQEDAAKLIGIGRTTLIDIEQGKRRLKAEELIKLAHGYGRQVSDFVRPRPEIEPFAVTLTQFRGPSQLTEGDRKAIQPAIQQFEDLCRDYLELEDAGQSQLRQRYPAEYAYAGLPLDVAAETLAQEERVRLGLGDGPIAVFETFLSKRSACGSST